LTICSGDLARKQVPTRQLFTAQTSANKTAIYCANQCQQNSYLLRKTMIYKPTTHYLTQVTAVGIAALDDGRVTSPPD